MPIPPAASYISGPLQPHLLYSDTISIMEVRSEIWRSGTRAHHKKRHYLLTPLLSSDWTIYKTELNFQKRANGGKLPT